MQTDPTFCYVLGEFEQAYQGWGMGSASAGPQPYIFLAPPIPFSNWGLWEMWQ